MNKRFLLAAALLAGAAAVQSPTTTSTPAEAPRLGEQAGATVSRQFASRKPAPAKPASQPVRLRSGVEYLPLAHLGVTGQIIEKPHLRKVKYGKRRWVMV